MFWIKHFTWLLLWLFAVPVDGQTVLLNFYADWCGPCKTMAPVIKQLAAEGYRVHRIDVDKNPQLANMMSVQNLPCFIMADLGATVFFGQPGYVEVDRIVGVTTIEQIRDKLHRKPSIKREQKGAPNPAWRYERPVGHRAATVRIYCQDDARTLSIGSGTLVRWGERVVVLTARHVVKDAKKIVVWVATGKAYRARVLNMDATWDCAVLELAGLPDNGVAAVDVELGDASMQQKGNRLESCGYGPDGKLAANSGLFIGYKRSKLTPNGPDDWFEISGHARPGDSGGGVFNQRGRLVGVLWGTNGEVVVAVQAGRLHVLLDSAMGMRASQRALIVSPQGRTIDPKDFTLLQYRRPTPPKACPPGSNCGPNGCGSEIGDLPRDAESDIAEGRILPGPIPYDQDRQGEKKPMMPWRGGAVDRDKAQSDKIDKLLELERIRAARDAQSPLVGPSKPEPEIKLVADEPSPLLAGLGILGGVVVGFVVYFATQKS